MKKSKFMTKITKELEKANYYDSGYQFDIDTDNKVIRTVVIASKNGHEYRLVTMDFYDDKFDYEANEISFYKSNSIQFQSAYINDEELKSTKFNQLCLDFGQTSYNDFFLR